MVLPPALEASALGSPGKSSGTGVEGTSPKTTIGNVYESLVLVKRIDPRQYLNCSRRSSKGKTRPKTVGNVGSWLGKYRSNCFKTRPKTKVVEA